MTKGKKVKGTGKGRSRKTPVATATTPDPDATTPDPDATTRDPDATTPDPDATPDSDSKPTPFETKPTTAESTGSDAKPVEPKLIEPKPIEPKLIEPKPIEPKPIEPKPIEPKPIGPKPIEPDPVKPKPVEADPVEIEPVEPKPVAKPVEQALMLVEPAGDGAPEDEPSSGAPTVDLEGAITVPRGRAGTVRAPHVVEADGWPLDTSEAEIPLVAAAPAAPDTQNLPDPKAAALQAARIAGDIVGDISTAGGAAVVAAAAAGAALEAARSRARAEAGERPPDPTPPIPDPDAEALDPVVAVRMQRDRILRAMAEDVAAQAEAQVLAEGQSERADNVSARASSQRGASHPGAATSRTDDRDSARGESASELDPVEIAASAIQRLTQRARTEVAGLHTHYQRHDVLVLLLAFVIIVVAGRFHRGLVTPPTTRFSERGLEFVRSQAWLAAEPIAPPAPRIIHDVAGQQTDAQTAYHVDFTSTVDPNARIEVLIDRKPIWSNIVTGLELDRRTRWGELYSLDDSTVRTIADHDWLRTAFRYAHVPQKGDVPRVDPAIEFATIDRDQIYVVTLFGSPADLERMEAVIAPTLRVPTQTGLPLVPQTRALSQRTYPNAVARAFDSTVMVVAADLVDGRLRPRGGGSGVVVGSDGSILTNYHVVHHKDGRLHDVFVIGRFSARDEAPQLWCAGRPNRGKLQRDLDLALIKCDLDLDGRAWEPGSASVWATLPEGRADDVRIGQRLWVLGYPDVGGGGLTLSEGQVEGWTGDNATTGRDFLRTDASITRGNSGGPVVDDQGRLVGIAAAFRTRTSTSGGVVETSQVGLVRPLSRASCLLAIATVGWTPLAGANDCDLQPDAVEAPAEGVRISTKVVDAANEAPVRDALVMILRPGVSSKSIDVNRLDDQVLAWGRSNTIGEVQLKQPVPVPGIYTVMVVATNYEPLIGENELRLDANTPPFFDPWGKIWLRSR